ncbi:MAG: hypothetical protein AB8H12_17640 [Lewinella sp.]
MLKQTLLLALFLCTSGPAQMHATDTDPVTSTARKISIVNHLGREHFRIKTASAIYFYDPVAGGFSSIFDKLGNDWVSYADDEAPEYPAAAATKYRGVPNLVYGGEDDGAGHPGHQKCESRVVGRNSIHTVSLSGKWTWTWTFYANTAKLEVKKAPANQPYWFLYEGPAGGAYRPQSTFWATDLTNPSYVIQDHFAGNVHRAQHRYMFFGEDRSPYVFFMMQTTPDTKQDHISYLGNEKIGARDSPDGMIVAGFGRAENATPLLFGANTFLIGLTRYNVKDPLSVGRTRRRLEKLARKRGRSPKLLIR